MGFKTINLRLFKLYKRMRVNITTYITSRLNDAVYKRLSQKSCLYVKPNPFINISLKDIGITVIYDLLKDTLTGDLYKRVNFNDRVLSDFKMRQKADIYHRFRFPSRAAADKVIVTASSRSPFPTAINSIERYDTRAPSLEISGHHQ